MNIMPTQPVVTHPHETPRPAQSQTQETSRAVVAPARLEPMAEETRRGEDRDRGQPAHADAHAHRDAAPAKPAQDPLVGAILDVFA